MNSKQNIQQIKIVYSLKIHTQLQLKGFEYLKVMPNPKNDEYNCWVYEATPAFLDAFDSIVKGGYKNGK